MSHQLSRTIDNCSFLKCFPPHLAYIAITIEYKLSIILFCDGIIECYNPPNMLPFVHAIAIVAPSSHIFQSFFHPHPSIHSFTFIHPSIHSHSFIYPSILIHSFIHPFLFVHSPIHSHPSIHPLSFIHPSILIHPSIHSHSFICPPSFIHSFFSIHSFLLRYSFSIWALCACHGSRYPRHIFV